MGQPVEQPEDILAIKLSKGGPFKRTTMVNEGQPWEISVTLTQENEDPHLTVQNDRTLDSYDANDNVQVEIHADDDDYADDSELENTSDHEPTGSSDSESTSSDSRDSGSESDQSYPSVKISKRTQKNLRECKRNLEVMGIDSEEEELMSNPRVQKLMHKILTHQTEDSRPKTGNKKGDKSRPTTANVRDGFKGIKSPSDMTLYAPALCLMSTPPKGATKTQPIRGNSNEHGTVVPHEPAINHISQFVEQMRSQQDAQDATPTNSHEGSWARSSSQSHHGDRAATPGPSREAHESRGDDSAQWKGDHLLIQAEQFKASVTPPQGMPKNMSVNFEELIRSVMENDDDQFFHLTCHVDGAL